MAIKWLYVFMLSFRMTPACRRRHLFVYGAFGVRVRPYIYCSTLVCVYFYMYISTIAPYTICEAKKERITARVTTTTIINNRNGRREVYGFSR